MMLKVRCLACNELIATIDTETIKLPLKGDMFEASEQMYQRPFHPTNNFDDFRCPYGPHDATQGHKPFFIEGEFLTENYRKWIIGETPKDYPETPEERRQKEIDKQWPDNEVVLICDGEWVEPVAKDYPCRYCDKVYNHKSSRSRHEKECKLKG